MYSYKFGFNSKDKLIKAGVHNLWSLTPDDPSGAGVIKCAANAMCSNHPEHVPLPGPWKNRLPPNWSLLPKMLGTAVLKNIVIFCSLKSQVFPSLSQTLILNPGSHDSCVGT